MRKSEELHLNKESSFILDIKLDEGPNTPNIDQELKRHGSENDTFREIPLAPIEQIPSSLEVFATEQNPVEIFLNRLYYSNECKYYYLFLIFVNTVLISWTLIDYKKASRIIQYIYIYVYINIYILFVESWAFLIIEILVNSVVVIDLLCRMRMIGWRRYWKSIGNIFEVIIVIVCLVSFALAFVCTS